MYPSALLSGAVFITNETDFLNKFWSEFYFSDQKSL